mgnify:CR=1 FL=1
MTEEEINNLDYMLNSDNEKGYVLEVDLSFPKDLKLYNRFNDLPLAPENVIPPNGKVPKYYVTFMIKRIMLYSIKY